LQRKSDALRLSELESRMVAFRPEGISEREARQHAGFYAEDIWKVKYPANLEEDRELTYSENEKLDKDLFRYRQGEPIQYVIGQTSFYGLTLKVNPSVLIPRQETEELVHMILKDHPEPYARVLDIGTGSGCIAIALQYNRPVWYMQAIDVSETALDIAMQNASLNKVDIDLQKSDILLDEWSVPIPFDIIVSNPPYIPYREKDKVGVSTHQYEPGLALWVPDNDPLLFYREIAEKSTKLLKPGGMLYFEVNEFLSAEVGGLLQLLGFADIRIFEDLMGKQRMVTAIK